jgi:hypothetical protein
MPPASNIFIIIEVPDRGSPETTVINSSESSLVGFRNGFFIGSVFYLNGWE